VSGDERKSVNYHRIFENQLRAVEMNLYCHFEDNLQMTVALRVIIR